MKSMSLFRKKRIFLDYASGHDNPSGIHKEGRDARIKVSEARDKFAKALGVQSRDIIFTSSGTESDNLAILGVFEEAKKRGVEHPHIIVGEREHPAVLESALEAKRRGGELTISNEPLKHLKPNTVLVSMMYVNNETGEINPIPKIARALREERRKAGTQYPYLHTDASQALSTLPVFVSTLGVDLLTLDTSKFGGPKGCGVLVVRPPVTLHPLIFGGGQERGLRSGTENVSAIVASRDALENALSTRDKESSRLRAIQKLFIRLLEEGFPNAVINTKEDSVPNIVSVSFPGFLHEFLAVKLDEESVAVSTGSSCSSLKDEADKEALRFSFGRDTRESDIKEVIRILKKVVI